MVKATHSLIKKFGTFVLYLVYLTLQKAIETLFKGIYGSTKMGTMRILSKRFAILTGPHFVNDDIDKKRNGPYISLKQ